MRDVWCQGLLEGLYQGFLWQVCLEMLTCWKGDTSSSKIEAMDLTFTWQSRLTWEVWKSECFHLQILRTRQRVQCLNRKFGGLLFLAHGFAHLFRYVRPLSCQQKGQHPLENLSWGPILAEQLCENGCHMKYQQWYGKWWYLSDGTLNN